MRDARSIVLSACLTSLLGATPAHGGANAAFSLPLHAKRAAFATCGSFGPLNCTTVRPSVTVAARDSWLVYLLVDSSSQLAGIQTAFAWPPDWTLGGARFQCQPDQVTIHTPENPGGPVAGTLSTSFDCISGTRLAVIGYMSFVTGESGCLRQLRPSYPNGVHAVDCMQGIDRIDPDVEAWRLGSICVNQPGVDACRSFEAVEASTWGDIKVTFR